MGTTQQQIARSDDARSGLEAPRNTSGPELPSLSGVLIGSFLTVTGFSLMMSVGPRLPPGLLMFVAGLGLMLTPKRRDP